MFVQNMTSLEGKWLPKASEIKIQQYDVYIHK